VIFRQLQKYIGENSAKRLFGGIVMEKNNAWNQNFEGGDQDNNHHDMGSAGNSTLRGTFTA